MIVRMLSSGVGNYPWIFLNIAFPSIKNENNMNLDDDEAAVYLSVVTSAFFYGGILGALLIKIVAVKNPKIVWRCSVLGFSLINILFQFESLPLMAICRFFQGMFGRGVIISTYWWMYEAALPKHRARFVSIPLLCYSVLNIAVYLISFLDDGGRIFWRALAIVPTILGIILFFIDTVVTRKHESIAFSIRSNGYEKTLQIYSKTFDPVTAK